MYIASNIIMMRKRSDRLASTQAVTVIMMMAQ
jgi:hypothetical protein